jgi:hypothetical protein
MRRACRIQRYVRTPSFCNNGAPGYPVSDTGLDPLDQRASGDHIP